MKKFVSLFLVICLLLPSSASAISTGVPYPVAGGNIYFDPYTGYIIDCDREVTSVEIPEMIQGVTVTGIEKAAFSWCPELVSVTIPDTITYIGTRAFYYSKKLESIRIPNSVTDIGVELVRECDKIKHVQLPEGMLSLEEAAFLWCFGLEKVYIPASVKTINAFAFEGCSSLTDIYYGGSMEMWNAIYKGNHNEVLETVTVHPYSTGFSAPAPAPSVEFDLGAVREADVIKAKILLDQDNRFRFYLEDKSVAHHFIEEVDPWFSAVYYGLDNYVDAIYASQKTLGIFNPVEVTIVEFYEALLLDILGYTKSNVKWAPTDAEIAKYFTDFGIETLTEIDKDAFKELSAVLCGDDGSAGVGILDALIAEGASLDALIQELTTLACLSQTTDSNLQVLSTMDKQTNDKNMKEAIRRVTKAIETAREGSMAEWLAAGGKKRADSLCESSMKLMVEYLYSLHPATKVFTLTSDGMQIAMNEIFKVKDISTDILYLTALCDIEDLLRTSFTDAELRFTRDDSGKNAREVMALAEIYINTLITGCEIGTDFVDHVESGKIPKMINDMLSHPLDFEKILAALVRGTSDVHDGIRDYIQITKWNLETTDFYDYPDKVLAYIREVTSTTPSDWAAAEVNRAISLGLLPEDMCYNYQSNITRLEFCALIDCLITESTGKTTLEWISEMGTPLKVPFDDAMYVWANDIAKLGIINGVGNNMFNPLGEITRQEAATMLLRTAEVLGFDTTSYPYNQEGIAEWAQKGVDFVTTKGIMNGTDKGFEPSGKYTKEQAIITMLRFYTYTKGAVSIFPSDLLYHNGHGYKLYEESMTWQEAKEQCERMGGHLVTITSAEEQRFIERIMDGSSKHQYWIGLTSSSGFMTWVTGEMFSYSNWDRGEPNHQLRSDGETENYVHIYNVYNPAVSGSKRFCWNDMFYDNTYPGEENNFSLRHVGYICEWDIT